MYDTLVLQKAVMELEMLWASPYKDRHGEVFSQPLAEYVDAGAGTISKVPV